MNETAGSSISSLINFIIKVQNFFLYKRKIQPSVVVPVLGDIKHDAYGKFTSRETIVIQLWAISVPNTNLFFCE